MSSTLYSPSGIAVNAGGTFFYWADYGSCKIRMLNVSAMVCVAGLGTSSRMDGLGLGVKPKTRKPATQGVGGWLGKLSKVEIVLGVKWILGFQVWYVVCANV